MLDIEHKEKGISKMYSLLKVFAFSESFISEVKKNHKNPCTITYTSKIYFILMFNLRLIFES